MNIESEGTAIADDEIEDASTNSWTTAYAYIDMELRPSTDDLGYVNTENFLTGIGNNHYFVLDIYDVPIADDAGMITGGWFAFNILGGGYTTIDRNDHRYYCWALSDEDLKRDLQSDGTYDPTGLWTLNLAVDLTAFATGNNVTIDYDYIMYADWNNFVEKGSWGADVELAGEETFFIQY